ncbi:DNA-binding Lrp family transcriptional regulator, partial [Methanobacterium petrolearium]
MKENEKKIDTVEIDDIDRKIISLFNEDGRMSYRKIAKRL